LTCDSWKISQDPSIVAYSFSSHFLLLWRRDRKTGILIFFSLSGKTLISNLFAITGHGSKGWTLSFGSCALLADLIDGKTPEVLKKFKSGFLFLNFLHQKYVFFKINPHPYSPLRFHPFKAWLHSQWDFAVFETTWYYRKLLACLEEKLFGASTSLGTEMNS